MIESRLNELIQKWVDKTTTREEAAELLNFLSLKKSASQRRAFAEAVFNGTEEGRPLAEEDADRIVAEITRNKGRVYFMKSAWVRYAAVVVAIFASVVYFYPAKQKAAPSNATLPSYANDILPGTQKAVLTLGDGRTVVLDSVDDGRLATQGAAEVVKLSNGSVSYLVKHDGGQPQPTIIFNTLTTPRGGQYQLTLPDGTRVWLNAASSIRYPTAFTGTNRSVTVEGEAYFEVSTNPSVPFEVKVGDKEVVKVLGTRFNINAYENEPLIKTTLLDGSVNLTSPSLQQKNSLVQLKPGQQAQFFPTGEIKVIDHADVNQAVAWKNGIFSFVSTDLETIMRQMARWYDVDVVYQDRIADTYTATFSLHAPVSNLFRFIEMSGGVHFEINGKKITVKK